MKKFRFTIKQKILSLTILIIVCLLAFVIVIHWRINSLQQETNFITHQDRQITSLTNQIEKNILDMETDQRGYVITGDDKFLEPFRQGLAAWETNFDELSILNAMDSVQQSRLQSIKNNIEQWIELSAQHVIQLKKAGEDGQVGEFFKTNSSIDQMDHIRNQISAFRDNRNENTNRLITNQADRNTVLLELLYIVWFLIAAAAVSASVVIARSISRTASQITGTLTDLVKVENLNTRISITSNDEISDLGQAVNLLLDNQQERLRLQQQEKEMLSEYQGITQTALLGDVYLSKLAKIMDYPYATLYVRTQDNGQDFLTRVSAFAGTAVGSDHEQVNFGEGLVGQCAKEGRLIHVDHLPEPYIHIRSGLGAASPQSLVLIPVSFLGEVLAVVEIASFKPLSSLHILFLESTSGHFGAALNGALSSMKIDGLLKESQSLNEELQVYTEELQTQSEELHIQTEILHDTNKKLEEKQVLAEQKTLEAEQAQEELTQYAKILQQSTQYKSEFLANMSHELRTPLNGILLLSEFLMENQSERLGDEEVEFSQAIHSAGQDLLALINDILDLSKVEAGKMNIEIEAVNITEIPEMVLQSFGQLSRKKELPFHVHLEEGVPEIIYTDAQRLRQILSNLLSNAFKFTIQGSVTFRIGIASLDELEPFEDAQDSHYIRFSVTDTGIGISENKQALIFDAFQQADGHTEREYGGTGLGLSITKQLVSLLGGKISLVSEKGAGSTFNVYLPPARHAAVYEEQHPLPEKPAETPDELVAAAGTGYYNDYSLLADKEVLIVDDDERNLFALTKILEKNGLNVTKATNGQEAVEYLQTGAAVDMILMDIIMPVMNGYDTIKWIRQMPFRQETPVIALTAKAMQEDRTRILEAGATEYLSKPVNMEQLLTLMKMII